MLASSFAARRYARWHDRRPHPRRSWPFVAMRPTVRRTPARRSLRLSAGARWAPRRLSRDQSQSPALYPEQSHTPAAAAWCGNEGLGMRVRWARCNRRDAIGWHDDIREPEVSQFRTTPTETCSLLFVILVLSCPNLGVAAGWHEACARLRRLRRI